MEKGLFLISVCLGTLFINLSLEDHPTNVFSLNLIKTVLNIDANGSNTVLSPLSLYDVLAVVQQGSGGASLEELSKVLQADPNTTRKTCLELVSHIKKEHKNIRLEFSNKIYVQENFRVNPKFQDIAAHDFQSAVDTVDFTQSHQAAETINSWVAKSTHGKVTDLVTPGKIAPTTQMLLLNAVFFSGEWIYRFDEFGTQNESFTTIKGQKITVPMMHLEEFLGAAHNEELGAHYVHLPIRGNDYKMVVVVPDEVHGLVSVVNNLQKQGLSSILNYTEDRSTGLKMPRFKFTTNSNLLNPLQKLGIKEIFSRNANLSGITNEPLYVSDVVQKAEIEVTETGITAAAATGVHANFLSAMESSKLLKIKADHPFLFFIVNREDSVPLFSGWVGEP